MKRVYLDIAAATPLDSRVATAMKPYWDKDFGNPSSLHNEGRVAKRTLEEARNSLASFMHAQYGKIIFTSGGTESNSLAILGTLSALKDIDRNHTRMHIVTSVIEHPSILDCFKQLEHEGFDVSYVQVDKEGIVDIEELGRILKPSTALISIMQANNEIGTIQPIAEIARIIKRFKERVLDQLPVHDLSAKGGLASGRQLPLFHTDASQTPLFMNIDIRALGVDLLSIDAQKLYGPKGVGALYVREGVPLGPLFFGGVQERGMRPGTPNVPAIVGLVKAYEIAEKEREQDAKRIIKLRDYFIDKVLTRIPRAVLNGSRVERLPNNANISIPGTESEFLVIALDEAGIACSTRSACLSNTTTGEKVSGGSYVVSALSDERSHHALRFSLGRETTKKEIDYTIQELVRIVNTTT